MTENIVLYGIRITRYFRYPSNTLLSDKRSPHMEPSKLLKIINGSGFPLQLGISSLIEETTSQHGWRVMFQEHSWANYETESGGFIDLLLLDKSQSIVLNLECKRVKDVDWLFLNPANEVSKRRHIKAFHTIAEYGSLKKFTWSDVTGEPSTPESEYCVFGGQDGASRSMLEKLAAGVIESTEGFAIEDHSYSHKIPEFTRYYFNVIVTTANLHVISFDPKTIDITTGEVSQAGSAEVPYLRFRKQLSIHSNPELSWNDVDVRGISRAKENTVFVVNSNHIIEFLENFELDEQYLT